MNKLAALLSLSLLLAACDLEGGEPNPPGTNSPPMVTLTASPQSGPAPLAVTFTATATDPDGDALSYAWSLADVPDSATVSTTFEEVGDYPVTVTVSDGQSSATASVTVAVTEGDPTDPEPPTNPEPPANPDPPTNPEPPTNPGPTEPMIRVTASPGGPVPWAVRYDYSAIDYPSDSTYDETCNVAANADYTYIVGIDDNSFACFHTSVDESVTISVLSPEDGADPIDQKTVAAKVQPSTGVPFEGTWRYTVENGKTGTFTVTQAMETGDGGTDATGDYSISYYVDDPFLAFDFTQPGGSAAMFPQPRADGTQVYISLEESNSIILEKID